MVTAKKESSARTGTKDQPPPQRKTQSRPAESSSRQELVDMGTLVSFPIVLLRPKLRLRPRQKARSLCTKMAGSVLTSARMYLEVRAAFSVAPRTLRVPGRL